MDKKNPIPSQKLAWYPRPHDINFTFTCRFLSSRRKSLPLVVRVQILGKTLPFQWENCLWRFALRQLHPGTSQSEYNKKKKRINAMPKTLTFCKRTATATSLKFSKISVWLIYFCGFAYKMSIKYLFTDYCDIVVGVAVNAFALHLYVLDIYPAAAQLFDILSS